MKRKLLQLLTGAAFALVGAISLGQTTTHTAECDSIIAGKWFVKTCKGKEDCDDGMYTVFNMQDNKPAVLACNLLSNDDYWRKLYYSESSPGEMSCSNEMHIPPYDKPNMRYSNQYAKYFDALCNATGLGQTTLDEEAKTLKTLEKVECNLLRLAYPNYFIENEGTPCVTRGEPGFLKYFNSITVPDLAQTLHTEPHVVKRCFIDYRMPSPNEIPVLLCVRYEPDTMDQLQSCINTLQGIINKPSK